MCQPIIQSVLFDQGSYGVGAIMTATVAFTACCSGPFTGQGSDTGGLAWTVSSTDGVSFVKLQAQAATTGTFNFTATVTSNDGLSDSDSWPFTVGGVTASKGLIGGTCNPAVYSMSAGQAFTAAQHMDSFLPASINPAETRQKVFWSTEGSFPGTSDAILMALLNNGVKCQISVKPTRTTTGGVITSQQAALTTAINAVLAVSTNIEINLWQEPTPQAFPVAGSPSYPTYWADYAPTIKATGAKCIFDPGCNNSIYAFHCTNFPLLSPVPDIFYTDFYIDSFGSGCRPDQISGNAANGFSTTSYMALADAAGIPFGIGEFGYNNSNGVPTTDNIAMWGSPIAYTDSAGAKHTQSYMSYIISLFQARLAAGKNNADICGFFSGASAPNGNIYGSFFAAGDFKSGLYTQPITDTTGHVSTQTILGLKQLWNAGI
jgi:hypothetical protein